jgi:parvulin-like peptidyl-prolyl isomerase
MRHFPKTYSLAAGVAVLAALAAANSCGAAETNESKPKPAGSAEALFPDPVVAKGKDFEIKRSQLEDEVIRYKGDLARLGRTVSPAQATLVDREVLESMIQMNLLLAKATDAEKAKAKESAEKRLATEKASASSEESFVRQLKAVGLTPELRLARLMDAAIAEAVLERELNVSISDDAVKKFYDENPARFEQPETVRVAHILFLTRDATGAELSDEQKRAKWKKAEEVLRQIRAGEDFGKLAKASSEDSGTKDRGGEMQPIPRGMLLPELPEFEAAAFALATNQVSDIVTTKIGYHIIKVLEKTPAKMAALEKVTDTIRQILRAQEFQKRAPAYFEKLKQEADVEILDKSLKAVNLPPPADQGAGK